MFVYSQLEYAQLHNLTAAPTPGKKGLIYHDTVLLRSYIDNGTVISAILANDQKCIFGTSGTASSNIRLNRAAAGVLQFVTGADTTAEASLSTALAQISARVENYITASIPAAGNAGRIVFDTSLSLLKYDNGASFQTINPSAINQYDVVIASPAITNFSTHTTIATGIAAASNDDEMLQMNQSFTENVSLSKRLHWFGQGYGSVVDGTLTIASGADYSIIEKLRFTGNIVINAGVVGVRLVDCFLAAGKTVTDNGTGNYIDITQI